MKIGFIGTGKMGGQMVTRLLAAGHEAHVVDLNPDALAAAVAVGGIVAADRQALVAQLDQPAVIWLMIPSQFVDTEIDALLNIAPSGTVLIDGGNSDYRLTKARAERAALKGIYLVDVGTSGGILGMEKGFSMMVGGNSDAVTSIAPIFEALAQPNGWKYFGPSGAGHYIKMVHNAIEYGMMESYAEGYHLLKEGPYKEINLSEVGTVWQHGSIINSLLNELTAQALAENPELDGIEGFVAESGETRWALETAKEHAIAMPVIQASFDVRIQSQQGNVSFTTKLLAAMRNKFGGHQINKQ
jgi:6-phosphogluconate dehydrogenase